MTVAPALRQIETDLRAALANPDGLDAEVVEIAARRIGAQAEMIDLGLDGVEPSQ